MSRHYWPEPPTSSTQYLVEHEHGEIHRLTLDIDNEWSGDRFRGLSRGKLILCGYLGVRTPFSEESERVEFEAVFGKLGGQETKSRVAEYSYLLEGWLARARHEKGIK